MLVDAHVHVWNVTRLDYPWLDSVPVLNRTFTPEQIDRADGATTHAVFVQAGCLPRQSLAEARWVEAQADAWPELSAIVAAADLRSGAALDAHLDALASLDVQASPEAASSDAPAFPSVQDAPPGQPSGRRVPVAGIRHLLQDESPELLADPASTRALVDGLRRLAERGLTFDLCVRHPQLDTAIDLLERVPELPTVLDHVGKPPVDDTIDSASGRSWARAIDRLAALPHAHVKLSGLAAEASTAESLDAHVEEFLVHALNAFGPARSMIGSDWPVSALTGAATTFASWRERVRAAAATAGCTGDAARSIESETAVRFYRLPVPRSAGSRAVNSSDD
ncbi:amidohydrolase [Humibacter sp. RRB41]|uniref:amidohydrolase family protein n=1 Tax=Humibacter sp. RRB41 TaxID=2919946 RepID=UPI001FAADC21|nr:amidohydrolase family protein [Humibacter sp. RRB41]